MKRRWNVKSSIEDEYEKKTFRILYIQHNKKNANRLEIGL